MTDNQQPRDLVLVKLGEIREEIHAVRTEQALASRKIGAMAEGMVSIRKRLDDLDARMDTMSKDMHLVTLAVDEHTTRLDRIEARLIIPDA